MNLTPPRAGLWRTTCKFALLPQPLSDGSRVWLKWYDIHEVSVVAAINLPYATAPFSTAWLVFGWQEVGRARSTR